MDEALSREKATQPTHSLACPVRERRIDGTLLHSDRRGGNVLGALGE